MSSSPSPNVLTTAAEAIDYLYELRLFGTKLGLENPLRLARHFGNPQADLKFIHVAGTNGKGSVCAMLECIYRRAGYRVGLFTSPHLVHFGERIQVNRSLLPDESLVALVNEIREALSQFKIEHHPTFFEIVVVLGLLHFQREHCDIVIWETGMGGRLDATNIVQPILSVITNVGLDHQKWLGDTIEAIATQKAGIIKPHTPSVHGVMDPKAAQIIRSQAASVSSPLTSIENNEVEALTADTPLSLLGRHQQENAALALRAVEILDKQVPVPVSSRKESLGHVRWPGRLQTVDREGQCILLDGAHNEPSITALCEFLKTFRQDRQIAFLLGVLEDKGIENWIPSLTRLANRFYLAPVSSGRSLDTKSLTKLIKGASDEATVECYATSKDALDAALTTSPLLVVCGSIYLVGEIIGYLENETFSQTEQKLNDWGGTTDDIAGRP